MKKFNLSLLFVVLFGIGVYSQTERELSVTVTTSTAGGNYSPRNIIAIWIEDDAEMLKGLLQPLIRDGHSIIIATNKIEALQQLVRVTPKK